MDFKIECLYISQNQVKDYGIVLGSLTHYIIIIFK